MSLFEEMMEDCVILDRESVSDGMGGFTYTYKNGAHFSAAIVKDTSTEARIAERQGLKELYTVTVYKGAMLRYYDVFRRISDGTTFRVTSNIVDSETPKRASFQIGQVTAERWDLTT